MLALKDANKDNKRYCGETIYIL